jgi:ABC-type transport system involved in multi-copper enzyme maturation permease subunit
MKLAALIQLTFRESLAKKTFMAFFGISSLIILFLIFALNLDIVDSAQTYISVFGKQHSETISIIELVRTLEGGISTALFSAGLLLALFATSNLIPSMLQKGTIDLFISKPISRFNILFGRYLGASAIVAFNIFYLVLGTWLVLSLKTGVWNPGFLLAGVLIVLTFMILFSLMMFLGVLTTSGAFSLMITFLIIVFSPFLIERDKIYALLSDKIYGYLLDGLYHFLPKVAELGNITQQIVRGMAVGSWLPLWTSLFFTLCMFIFSMLLFYRKNF